VVFVHKKSTKIPLSTVYITVKLWQAAAGFLGLCLSSQPLPARAERTYIG